MMVPIKNHRNMDLAHLISVKAPLLRDHGWMNSYGTYLVNLVRCQQDHSPGVDRSCKAFVAMRDEPKVTVKKRYIHTCTSIANLSR